MRASTLLPMPFDREYPQRGKFRAFFSSRRTRYTLPLIAIICFLVILSIFSGSGHGLSEFLPSYLLNTETAPVEVLSVSPDPLWDGRASRVREAFVSAYQAYEKAAYPHDELLPTTDGFSDK